MSKENLIFDSSCFYIFMILHIMAQDLVWTLVKIELNQFRFPEMCLASGMRAVSRVSSLHLSVSNFLVSEYQSSERGGGSKVLASQLVFRFPMSTNKSPKPRNRRPDERRAGSGCE